VTAALDQQITRSKGILVGGFNPGGGHSGIDATLDALVADAAARLRELCGQAVEIRFNSDRRSGGAFLAEGPTVGLSVSQTRLSSLRGFDDEDFSSACSRMGIDPEGAEIQNVVRVMVDASQLDDPAIANNNGGGRPYAFLASTGLDDAIETLKRIRRS
jgi:hypothetical protein